MPCRDYDYEAETAGRRAAEHQRQITDMKKGLDNLTRMLRGVLHTVDDAKMPIIYKQVGGLQEWWERHQRLDAIREQKEQRAAARRERKRLQEEQQRQLQRSALNKLTDAERKSLGL